MSDHNYTFVAYKANSEHYCCGNSRQFPSDLSFGFELSREEVVDDLISCLLTNKNLSDQEEGFEVLAILHDGHPISSEERRAIFEEADQKATEIHLLLEKIAQDKKEEKARQDKEEGEKMAAILVEALMKEKNDVG